ncbi:MAG: single-stranded-DNA-specific exonuclease RecJ [Candidatus Promineifilaceae bacterium]
MIRPQKLRVNRWELAPEAEFEEKDRIDRYHPVLLQVLFNRGITRPGDISDFLNRRYLDTNPFDLADMDKAVARINKAIESDEQIVVYGDFDADGVTATVLLVQALRGLGLPRAQVVPYIPDRVDEGYGLNAEALEGIKQQGGALVISVDCGIRASSEAQYAKEIGLDLIITDHHNLGPNLPDASAVINPWRPDSEYPERRLAGVGISFKLAQALRTKLKDKAAFSEEDLLDLVAVGTVADLVPLLGENRVLVADGLEEIRRGKRPGIQALLQVAGIKPNAVIAESIAFGLGPRINAAGRLAHAYDAARLLAADNLEQARLHADKLDELNYKRRTITSELYRKAEEMIDPDDPVMVVVGEEFISGVVGLVASRLSDRYYRPAIVLEKGDEESRGSCRSIPGFHITRALDDVSDLLVRYGGHSQAAGFTIRNENLEAFQERINSYAADKLDEKDLVPIISVDAEVQLADVDWALHDVLDELEPTGINNPRPLLMSRDVRVMNHRAVGSDKSHLQLWIGDSYTGHKCIAFNQGAWDDILPEYIDLVYTVGTNEWNGRRDLQLQVKDIRAAS